MSRFQYRTENSFIVPYKIIESLGRGGMGEVFLIEDPIFSRNFVAKVILEDINQNEMIKARFEREIKILSRLDHPNIVKIVYFNLDIEQPFYFMEYCSNSDFGNLLNTKRDSISPLDIINIFMQIMDGLSFMHDIGIIHRDLKPYNVLIDSINNFKIADFGLAKIIDPSNLSSTVFNVSITETNQQIGTYLYMSPEQFDCSKTVDYKADIYSLGVMIYQAFTNRIFDADLKRLNPDNEDMLFQIVRQDFNNLTDIKLELRDELLEIVLSMLHYKPELRPDNINYIKDRFSNFIKFKNIYLGNI